MREIKEVIKQYLIENKYDGLCSSDYECACAVEDLFPCMEVRTDCFVGYKRQCDCEMNCDFHIGYEKELNDKNTYT